MASAKHRWATGAVVRHEGGGRELGRSCAAVAANRITPFSPSGPCPAAVSAYPGCAIRPSTYMNTLGDGPVHREVAGSTCGEAQ